MIIKRKNNRLPHPKDLFLVSSLSDLEGEYMYPGVPKNILTRSGYEDNKTPRISLFPSVNSGVMNLGRSGKNLKGSTLYVYRPVGGKPESLMKPDISQSPGSQITNELWYLASMRFKKIAEIKVGKKILPGHVYHYGPRSTIDYIYEWDWEEILEPWEKKGKLEEKEFGIVSDLTHSGIPRTYKKYIGRARRNLGNRIGRSIENDAKSLENTINSPRKFIYNADSGRTLKEVAEKEGLKINQGYDREILNALMSNEKVNLARKTDFTLPSSKVKDKIRNIIKDTYKEINNTSKNPSKKEVERIIDNEVDDFTRKIYNDSKKYKGVIQLGDRSLGESPEILAHEIGHNISNKSIKGKLINRASMNDFKNFNPRSDNSGKGILRGIKNYFKQKAVVKNEDLANKEGLKLLKKDLSPTELKSAEENMNKSLDKYKHDGKLFYKKPLWRTIQIPSRRKE